MFVIIEFLRKVLKYVIVWFCVILCIKIEDCDCCNNNNVDEPNENDKLNETHYISRPTPIKDKLQEKIIKELD